MGEVASGTVSRVCSRCVSLVRRHGFKTRDTKLLRDELLATCGLGVDGTKIPAPQHLPDLLDLVRAAGRELHEPPGLRAVPAALANVPQQSAHDVRGGRFGAGPQAQNELAVDLRSDQ